MAKDIESIFMFLFTIFISPSVKQLFFSFFLFLVVMFGIFYVEFLEFSLYTKHNHSFLNIWFANFSSMVCIFILFHSISQSKGI